MLTTIGMTAGFAIALIGVCDLVLTNAQKASVDVLAAKLWNAADEAKRITADGHPIDRRTHWMAMLVVGFVVVVILYKFSGDGDFSGAIIFAALVASVWIWPPFMRWVLANRILGRAALVVVIFMPPLVAPHVPTVLGIVIITMTWFFLVAFLAYLLVIFFAALLMSCTELILRRVTGYPKGALAAIGVVLGFGSAMLKLYQ